MPSFLQRLNSLKKQSAEKQNEILKHNKTISDARIKIQQLTAELADLNESAEMLEGRNPAIRQSHEHTDPMLF